MKTQAGGSELRVSIGRENLYPNFVKQLQFLTASPKGRCIIPTPMHHICDRIVTRIRIFSKSLFISRKQGCRLYYCNGYKKIA